MGGTGINNENDDTYSEDGVGAKWKMMTSER